MLVGSPCSTTLKATQRPGEITKPIPYSQRGGLGGKSLLQIGVLSPSLALMSGSWIRQAPLLPSLHSLTLASCLTWACLPFQSLSESCKLPRSG